MQIISCVRHILIEHWTLHSTEIANCTISKFIIKPSSPDVRIDPTLVRAHTRSPVWITIRTWYIEAYNTDKSTIRHDRTARVERADANISRVCANVVHSKEHRPPTQTPVTLKMWQNTDLYKVQIVWRHWEEIFVDNVVASLGEAPTSNEGWSTSNVSIRIDGDWLHQLIELDRAICSQQANARKCEVSCERKYCIKHFSCASFLTHLEMDFSDYCSWDDWWSAQRHKSRLPQLCSSSLRRHVELASELYSERLRGAIFDWEFRRHTCECSIAFAVRRCRETDLQRPWEWLKILFCATKVFSIIFTFLPPTMNSPATSLLIEWAAFSIAKANWIRTKPIIAWKVEAVTTIVLNTETFLTEFHRERALNELEPYQLYRLDSEIERKIIRRWKFW